LEEVGHEGCAFEGYLIPDPFLSVSLCFLSTASLCHLPTTTIVCLTLTQSNRAGLKLLSS
jgi:hypothetical protein